jgi:surface polysaccharide O-acyltransferase-like enzyme
MAQKQPSELMMMKSLAFLAVVFQSSLMYMMNDRSPHPEESIMMGMLFNFVKFSAPVFVFLAGFHMFQYEKIENYRTYITHKGKELMLPYLFWSIVYLMMFSNETSITHLVKELIVGDAAPHLWYVVMIIQFHLLAPLLLAFWAWGEKTIRSRGNFIVILASAYLLFIFLISNYVWTTSPIHYIDRSFLSYSFYFFLGGIAAKTLPKWRNFVMKSIPLNTFVFLALFILVGYELLSFKNIYSIDLKVSTYLKPSMVLYVTSEILLLYGLAMTIVQMKSPLYTILRFIHRYTYGAYLSHLFFLYWLATLIPKSTLSIVQSFFLFIVTTIASIGCSYLVHALPISKFVIGLEQEQGWSPQLVLLKNKKGVPR